MCPTADAKTAITRPWASAAASSGDWSAGPAAVMIAPGAHEDQREGADELGHRAAEDIAFHGG